MDKFNPILGPNSGNAADLPFQASYQNSGKSWNLFCFIKCKKAYVYQSIIFIGYFKF